MQNFRISNRFAAHAQKCLKPANGTAKISNVANISPPWTLNWALASVSTQSKPGKSILFHSISFYSIIFDSIPFYFNLFHSNKTLYKCFFASLVKRRKKDNFQSLGRVDKKIIL